MIEASLSAYPGGMLALGTATHEREGDPMRFYTNQQRGIHIVSACQLLFHVRSRKRDAIAHENSQALRDFIAHGGIEWLARQSSDKFQAGKALGFGGFFTRLNNA